MPLETPGGLVLVDTGFGTSDVDTPRRSLPLSFRLLTNPLLQRAETAVQQIARLGHDPADVRHVVLTHLDVDHAGGLRDFPRAQVHVHGPELRAATAPKAPWRYRREHWAHGPEWISYEERGEPWFGFDAVRGLRGLGDEVLLVPLAGHTAGHAGVAVDTGDRWLLHAGDAYFHHGELAAPPHSPPGVRAFQAVVDEDRTERARNTRRLQQLVDGPGEIDVVCSHDPADLHRHRSS